MKIVELAIFRVSLPMICGRYSCTSESGITKADSVIVRITTDEGIFGYGETCSLGGYPLYAAGIEAAIAELAQRHVLGQEPNANR